MRVRTSLGAPAGLLFALTGLGCAWIDSIRWQPPTPTPQTSARPASSTSASYVVRRGDTLSEIGLRHGIPVAELAYANRLEDPDRIAVGQRLEIPPAGLAPVSAAVPKRAERRAPPRVDATRALLDSRLHAADALLRSARFEEALSKTESARAPLAELESRPAANTDTREQRVRLELLAATACIALGRNNDAEQSFERALQADANLQLDPARVSPKVVLRFDQTRLRLASAPTRGAGRE